MDDYEKTTVFATVDETLQYIRQLEESAGIRFINTNKIKDGKKICLVGAWSVIGLIL